MNRLTTPEQRRQGARVPTPEADQFLKDVFFESVLTAGFVYEVGPAIVGAGSYALSRISSRFRGGSGTPCPTGPTEAYNRKKHYGSTPTAADRKAIGAGPGQVADHDPPLVVRYYEGDPSIGEIPGYQMTETERLISAADRTRMRVQPAGESNSQGGFMSSYSRKMRSRFNL